MWPMFIMSVNCQRNYCLKRSIYIRVGYSKRSSNHLSYVIPVHVYLPLVSHANNNMWCASLVFCINDVVPIRWNSPFVGRSNIWQKYDVTSFGILICENAKVTFRVP